VGILKAPEMVFELILHRPSLFFILGLHHEGEDYTIMVVEVVRIEEVPPLEQAGLPG
jgi:hypothetical protein